MSSRLQRTSPTLHRSPRNEIGDESDSADPLKRAAKRSDENLPRDKRDRSEREDGSRRKDSVDDRGRSRDGTAPLRDVRGIDRNRPICGHPPTVIEPREEFAGGTGSHPSTTALIPERWLASPIRALSSSHHHPIIVITQTPWN